jgi:hypothetical protein
VSEDERGVGLCAGCRHARRVPTPRSVFWLCQRAATDPRFMRYPRLPMLSCPGFEPVAPGSGEAEAGEGSEPQSR